MMISGVSSNSMNSVYMARDAQVSRPKPPTIDTNGDDLVSKDELTTFAANVEKVSGKQLDVDKLLATYDGDGDGQLNKAEMKQLMKNEMPKPPEGMGGVGPDENISLSKEEFSGLMEMLAQKTGTGMDAESLFASYDEDKSNSIDANELKSLLENETTSSSDTTASAEDDNDDEEMKMVRMLMHRAIESYQMNNGNAAASTIQTVDTTM
jgi:Ca2+-binding EF-hand superfamily protein